MSGSPLQTSGGTNYCVKTIICLTNIMHYNQYRDSHNALLISFIVSYIILLRSKLLHKSIHIIETCIIHHPLEVCNVCQMQDVVDDP